VAIHIGTSGWSYAHWDGVLYPHGLPPHERLARYVEVFGTAEVNSTFYRWPRGATFASWRRRLPDHFLLSVKAPRGLTHGRRLYGPEAWLARISEAARHLGDRLGPLLVQLPPDQGDDPARLEYFLAHLPPWLRVAVEFRHPGWHHEGTFALLERHGAAYCMMSGANLPCVLRATAPFVYIRLHGPDHRHLYAGSYSDADLAWWAARIVGWRAQGRAVFAYFNNDGGGNAVRDAARLRAILGE
jgi:uncharacterized protein YecE (DUF72 family)